VNPSRYSLLAKMSAAVAVFVVVLIGFGLYSAHTRSQVQVGGPYYSQIVLSKDIIADVLPPPAYIIEAYLLSFQIVNASETQERNELIVRLEQTEKEFDERQRVWRDVLPESPMKAALVVDSAKHAGAFFKVVHERFLPAIKAGDIDTGRQLANREMREAYTQHRRYIDKVVSLATQFGIDREEEAKAAVHRGTIWETTLGVSGLLAGIFLSGAIIRGLNRSLTRIAVALDQRADQMSSAAAQVSTSSQSLSDGASSQAASLEETSASLEEMAAMTKHNAESAVQAKEVSHLTRASADTGVADMAAMKQAMDAIKASSNDISKIIKTIDEIAFQTNILALNAAVEAARAGEAGAGFAVVAEEVRNLAQRSAQSAKETATKIEDSMKKSEHGVEISNRVATSLGDIFEKARQMDTLVAEIATASQEQTQGIGQLNLAVSQMDKVTQANAATAGATAAAAEDLTALAASMQVATVELHELIGRGNPDDSAPSAALPEPSDHDSTKKRTLDLVSHA
jgi:hypothetical protein